jgi:muramoyltetrapeptide carboxypeptidase
MIPPKLKLGDGVRVIALSSSLQQPWITEELKAIAASRFQELGLTLSFGKHSSERDEFGSSTIQSRIEDLHAAFSDHGIKLVMAVTGGFNSNQLLRYIDYSLIKANPRIFCGYSDITALSNAIHKKTGLVTYSGPSYTSFGDKEGFSYTLENFRKCLFSKKSLEVAASPEWCSGWSAIQDNPSFHPNEGYWLLNEGRAEGKIIGGNLCTLNLLQGTEYMPGLKNAILFIEDDYESQPHHFDRDLQSLIHLPDFPKVKAIVIGRFQKESGMTRELLAKIIKSKKELDNMPVIANADFGHTAPRITFPIGGKATLLAESGKVELKIIKH